MSSYRDADGLPSKSHDPQTYSMRSSRDHARRASRVHNGERYERHGNSKESGSESARARHWKTVLGKEATTDRSVPGSSSSSTGITQQARPYVHPTRPDHSRASRSSAISNESLIAQHPGRQYDPAWRHSRPVPPKPFGCDQCPRRFERRGHLESHVDAVHRLRQPYECDYPGCGKTFSHRSSLSRHIKGVHEKNRYRTHANSRNPRHNPQGPGPAYGTHNFGRS